MNALEGYEVASKPVAGARRLSKRESRGKIEAFLASGNECMSKSFSDDDEALSEYCALKNFTRRNGYPVIICKRNDAVILVRADSE